MAQIPKAALANPSGPLASMGHIDPAWTCSFQELDHGVDLPAYILLGDPAARLPIRDPRAARQQAAPAAGVFGFAPSGGAAAPAGPAPELPLKAQHPEPGVRDTGTSQRPRRVDDPGRASDRMTSQSPPP